MKVEPDPRPLMPLRSTAGSVRFNVWERGKMNHVEYHYPTLPPFFMTTQSLICLMALPMSSVVGSEGTSTSPSTGHNLRSLQRLLRCSTHCTCWFLQDWMNRGHWHTHQLCWQLRWRQHYNFPPCASNHLNSWTNVHPGWPLLEFNKQNSSSAAVPVKSHQHRITPFDI